MRFKDKAKLDEDTSLCQQWGIGGHLVGRGVLNFESITLKRFVKLSKIWANWER